VAVVVARYCVVFACPVFDAGTVGNAVPMSHGACCCRVTYTIDWQSDRVTWAMNGVPLLTQWGSAKAKPGMLPQSSAAAGGKRSLLR
jgi:hypothetical protein